LDAATTWMALQQPNLQEANAVYGAHPSPGRLIATKAAIMAPLALLLDRAYMHAAPGSTARKVALAAAIATGSLGALAGAHNLRTMQGPR
jgi:hypothetical protein